MRKKTNYLLGVCFVLLLIFTILFPYKQVLSFTYQDSDLLLAYLPISESKTFTIHYTHSIHLSEVIENYRIQRNTIVQTELSYEDFAIGMPQNAEGNEVFEVRDGRYYLLNMNRKFDYIDLRVGQVRANHKISYQDKVYLLTDFIEPGEWVRISTQKFSIWQLLKGVKMHAK